MSGTTLTEDQSDSAPTEEPTEDPAEAPASRSRPAAVLTALRRWATSGRVAWLVELLALVPLITVAIDVAGAQRLQFTDYWYVLLRITNGDGSLNPLGVAQVLQNEHPVMLPSLLYWLDARFTAGDNRALGFFVVAVAAATVVLLRFALPKSLPPLLRAGLVVAVSALVFSPHGLHNFVRAMSGTAWLTANLLVVAALLLAYRGRWWPAWLLGGLACMSYGTAFAVWPALALVAAINREPWWRRLLPLGAGLVVILAWTTLEPAVYPGGSPSDDLVSLMFLLFGLIGHLWTDRDAGVGAVAGVLIVVAYLWLLTTSAGRDRGLRFWWALAAYAFMGCGMIALARVDFGSSYAVTSRYTSLSVLMAVPLVVLLGVLAYRTLRVPPVRVMLAAIAVGVLGFTLGSPTASAIRTEDFELQLQAVAMRTGVSDAYGAKLPPAELLVPRLEAMGHYPFNADFTLGCGGPELGSWLDPASMRPLPPPGTRHPDGPAGWLDTANSMGPAVVLRGWATGVGDPVRCAVIVDADGTITGGGAIGGSRPDVTRALPGVADNVGFSVLAPTGTADRVVVILHSGATYWLPTDRPAAGA